MTESDNKVLDTVLSRIEYTFEKDVLVKPLAQTMVTKVIQKPTGAKDADGYDTTEDIEDLVASDWREGLVLSMPTSFTSVETNYTVGDTILFHERAAKPFDLFKDSMLVKPYDVVAIRIAK